MATRYLMDTTGLGDDLARAVSRLFELDGGIDARGGGHEPLRSPPPPPTSHRPAPPPPRAFTATGRWNVGEDGRRAVDDDSNTPASRSTVHLPQHVLARSTSSDLLELWSRRREPPSLGDTAPDGGGIDDGDVLPEYRPALRSVVVSPDIMRDSTLRRSLRRLRDGTVVWPPPAPFGGTVRELIRRGWPEEFGGVLPGGSFSGGWSRLLSAGVGGGDGASVENFRASVPGLADASGGSLYQGAMRLYESLGVWERPYLQAALERLIVREEAEGLRIVAGLMLRGSRECHARKRFVFCAIVNRVAGSGGDGISSFDGDPTSVDGACHHLREALTTYVDDVKQKAFRSTFLEPTKMYFRATGDRTLEGDVDVHGANVYLAVLGSALGVALDRTPYLRDGAKGVADFKGAGLAGLGGGIEGDEDGCWSADRMGVAWESIPACRRPQIRRRVPRNEFLFSSNSGVGGGLTAADIANAAVDPSPESAEARACLAPYLEQFCRYFSGPFILQRMFSHLTSGGAGPAAETALASAYGGLRMAMQGDGYDEEGNGPGMPEDARYFCWDLDVDPPVFCEENALMLFSFIGVCAYGDGVEERDYLDVDDAAADDLVAAGGLQPASRSPPAASCAVETYLDVD